MCGIIHVKRLDTSQRANKSLLKRFEKQRSRGVQGFGFVEIINGFVTKVGRAEGESDIKKMLNESKADEILFHHRFPTSTPNFVEATHPIWVRNEKLKYDYYVVHNGIITNDNRLRKEHIEKGFEYTTEMKNQVVTRGTTYDGETKWNDSEALAIDFALAVESDKKNSMESIGSIALVALQVDKYTLKAVSLFYGRNEGNPLCLESNNDMFCLSSENGKEIEHNTLYRYDYETSELSDIEIDIGTYFGYKKGNSSSWKWNKETNKLEEVKKEDRAIGFSLPPAKTEDIEEDDYVYNYKSNYYDQDFLWQKELELEFLQTELKNATVEKDQEYIFELTAEIETIEDIIDKASEIVAKNYNQ